jgi:guanylate kinase
MLIVVSAPSGTGKSTIIKEFLLENPKFSLSCSVTTRNPRENEINGVHYFFVSKEKFLDLMEKKEFFETEEIFDNYYGTLFSSLSEKNTIIDLNIHGLQNIKKIYKNCITIGIFPPTVSDLLYRLTKRGEAIEEIEKRLSNVQNEIKKINSFCDFILINKDLYETQYQFTRIIYSNFIDC